MRLMALMYKLYNFDTDAICQPHKIGDDRKYLNTFVLYEVMNHDGLTYFVIPFVIDHTSVLVKQSTWMQNNMY